MHASIKREQTLNSQVAIPYLIKHKQFEHDINLPTKREIFNFYHRQVQGDVTSPMHFLVSFWIERQHPVKEDRFLDKANINNLIEHTILSVEQRSPPFMPASFKKSRLTFFQPNLNSLGQ